MIKNNLALSMTEMVEYVSESGESNPEIKGFLKKYISLKPEKAKELRKKLEDLDLMKIKPEHIVKIIDLIPEDSEDINKIFTDVGLDEDETKKILETVKPFK